MNPIFFYIITSVWVLTGIFCLVYAFIITRKINAIKYWPSVPGEILSTDGRRFYDLKMKYKYWAEGIEYISDKHLGSFNTKQEAQATVDRYPPVGPVVAYYNPKKPQEAYVEPSGSKLVPMAAIFAGCVTLAMGIGFLVI